MSRKSASAAAALAAMLLGTSTALAAGGPASARSTDNPVPVTPTTKLTGKGFGHGIGMSQHGARNRAEQGQTPKTILQTYYPGTAAGTTSGRIRVLITADADNNTKVKAAPGLKLTDTGNGRTYRLPTDRNPRAWRLKVIDGKTRVHYKTSTWRLYRPGGRGALIGDGQFKSSTGSLTLKLASGLRVYRGALRFTNRDTVNILGIEGYLKGVVAAEMPAFWHQNALRAQAVAARTYAAFERADSMRGYFHVYDTTKSQVYGGVAAEQPQTNAAIGATAGQIRTYQGSPAFTQFSASNGGYSVAGSKPYLQAAADTFDNYPEWTKPLDAAAVATIQKRYPQLGTLLSVQVTSRDGKGAYGGRVLTLTLDGSNGDVTGVKGTDFRSLLGLRSTLFRIS
jgi:stage II sporulation protein D